MSEQRNKIQEYIELLAHDPKIQNWIASYIFDINEVSSEEFWGCAPIDLSDDCLMALFGLNSDLLNRMSKAESDDISLEISKDVDVGALYFQNYSIIELFFEHTKSAILNKINQLTYH